MNGRLVAVGAALLIAGAGCGRPVAGQRDAGVDVAMAPDVAAAAPDASGSSDAGTMPDRPPTPPPVDGPITEDTAGDAPEAPADGGTDGAGAIVAPDAGAADARADARNPCNRGLPDMCTDGCTDVLRDVRNCGACGNACPSRPNADSSCVSGKCVATCKASWFDCKPADVADGCETRIDTPEDCGMCGREACPGTRFIGTCVNGAPVCAARICRAGYGNCDPAGNDCETPWTSAASPAGCFPTLTGTGTIGSHGVAPMFVAVTADGATYAAGFADGSVDIDPTGGVDMRALPLGGVFLIRLDAAGGYVWGQVMPAPNAQTPVSIAGLAAGTDGSAAITGASGSDPFVVKVSAAGAVAWTKTFPASGSGGASTALVAGPDGGFVLLGHFSGPIDLDPGPVTDQRSSTRVDIPFLVGLDGDGARRWVATFDQAGDSCGGLTLSRMVAASAGALIVSGNFYGDCDLAPGSRVERRTITPESSAIILKLDGSGAGAGAFLGARLLRSPQSFAEVADVGVAPDGSLYVGGSFDGKMDFDDGTTVLARQADVRRSGFLMKMTASLGVSWVSEGMADLWVLQLEPTPDQGVLAVFVQETGALSLTKLDGNQQPSWTMPFGGAQMQTQIFDLAVGAGGFVVAGTDTSGSDLDPGAGVSRVPAGAGFLARFRF